MRLRAKLLEIDNRARMPVLLCPPETAEPPKLALPASPCTKVLSTLQWQTLWMATQRDVTLPQEPPDCMWAMKAIAKLGGWNDSKQTGRPLSGSLARLGYSGSGLGRYTFGGSRPLAAIGMHADTRLPPLAGPQTPAPQRPASGELTPPNPLQCSRIASGATGFAFG